MFLMMLEYIASSARTHGKVNPSAVPLRMSTLNLVVALSAALVYGAPTPTPSNVDSSVVSIPYEYTYLLPNSYYSNLSEGFVDTTISSDASINALFASAQNAPFISYSQEFLDIIGPNPQLKLIEEIDTGLFAYEGGIWLYDRNEVWFTSSVQAGGATTVRALKLDTYEIYEPKISSDLVNPNGATYWNGTVYFATYQSKDYPGGIMAVDPATGEVTPALNSYFGLRFNAPDDMVWVRNKAGKEYLFWTDLDYAVRIISALSDGSSDYFQVSRLSRPPNPRHSRRSLAMGSPSRSAASRHRPR